MKTSDSCDSARGDPTTVPHTVLCIDDRPQTLQLRQAALEPHGYRVKLALSGYAALKTLEGAPVDAVLLEYKPEGIDAEAVAGHIKQRFPAMPIILLSAYAEMPGPILWLVDEYLMKSELPQGLVAVVERITHSPKTGVHKLSFRRKMSA